MDSRTLRNLMRIVQTGSLSAAAEHSCLTVQALAAQLNKVEEQFGFRLFRRSNKGLTLTSQGSELTPFMDQVLVATRQLEDKVAALKTPRQRTLRVALNTTLPGPIPVMSCEDAPRGFHARYSATGKTYCYEISTEPVLSPFRHGRAWHLPRQLDPYMLKDALDLYAGRHDFEAFGLKRGYETEETSYVRTISAVSLEPLDWGWRIRYTGDGFLYKMVRLLTGTAVHAAQGRMRLDEVAAFLDQPPGLPLGKAPQCAPPDGLFLETVHYGGKTPEG